MEKPLVKFDRVAYEWETYRARDYIETMRKRLADFDADAKKKERTEKAKCKYCEYIQTSRMGGCAMTRWYCGLCGCQQMHGNTATDRLCIECAKERGLCKQCGGDVDGKIRRKVDLEFRERASGKA